MKEGVAYEATYNFAYLDEQDQTHDPRRAIPERVAISRATKCPLPARDDPMPYWYGARAVCRCRRRY